MPSGNFVAAGGDTYVALMKRFMPECQDLCNDEVIINQLNNSVDKFLYSFGIGVNYKTKKLSGKHVEKFLKVIKEMREAPFMKDTKLYWDSGGFQIANGAFYPKDIPIFIDKYYQCVKDNPDLFDYAFILDVPPGPGSEDLFSSYEQIEQLNRMSYQKCKSLMPPETLKKVIYIHHFRNLQLFDTWNKFLFEEDLADGYEYFGTGGIVANLAADISNPIVLYTIPLSSIILYAKKKGLKKFKFHVLGGANFRDVFYHKVFEHHIKKYHDIEVEITFDSSAIFKAMFIGRHIHVFNHDGDVIKMDFRSNVLDTVLKGSDVSKNDPTKNVTVREKLYSVCDDLADDYGFDKLDPNVDPIYDPVSNSLTKKMHILMMAYVLDFTKKMEQKSEEMTKELYPYYAKNDEKTFNQICNSMTKMINQGKITKKQKAKTNGLFKSLQILEKLDLDFNRKCVQQSSSNDNISDSEEEGGILTWDV
jgi:hypothetical protein